jgi:hypothetical protein
MKISTPKPFALSLSKGVLWEAGGSTMPLVLSEVEGSPRTVWVCK